MIAATSQLLRNAHVVLAPEIMRDFGVSAAALGALTGALFIATALTQIPAGVLIDHFEPRRTLPVMLLLAVPGSFSFASAPSVPWLTISRLLTGTGVATLAMEPPPPETDSRNQSIWRRSNPHPPVVKSTKP